MSKQVRVNLRTNADTKSHRTEKRNGRDVIIVSSATLPDNVVMNDIRYPAEEIAKSFATLERTPAPLGHPRVNGKFVSARDPEGINTSWIGAHNENVRQEGGRVLLDKVIDVEVANRTQEGRDVISAIQNGESVHTSTGLIMQLTPTVNDADAKFNGHSMVFDHDAILLNEDGAATPEQGVGMMVNASGDEFEVINSVLDDDTAREMNWAIDSMVRAHERKQRAPLLERIQATVAEFLGAEQKLDTNESEDHNMADDAKLTEVANSVGALTTAMNDLVTKLPDIMGNAVKDAVKPMTDNFEAMNKRQKEADEAELEGHKKKIIKANILDEAGCEGLTLNAAKALAERATPKGSAGLNGINATNSSEDEFKDIDLNANMKGDK